MKISVFTASTPSWSPEEVVTEVAAAGADGVEWRVVDQDDAPEPGFWAGNRATIPLTGLEERVDGLARITREAGLEISGIGGYAQASDHSNVERLLRATARLGAGRVRVTMPQLGTGRYPELFAHTRADLERIAPLAAELGVKALVELHHRTITASASSALRLLDGLDPAAVGVIHDSGNLAIEGWEDTASTIELLGPYLAHVHVKNVAWRETGRADDGAAVWEHPWAPLRDGSVDVRAYVGAFVAAGFDGWITLEDFSTETPLRERTRDNVAYLRSLLP